MVKEFKVRKKFKYYKSFFALVFAIIGLFGYLTASKQESMKGSFTESFHTDEYYEVVDKSNIDAWYFPKVYTSPVGDIAEVEYSELDELGRTGEVKATITYDMIKNSEGTREKWEDGYRPSGWYVYKWKSNGNLATEKEYIENKKRIEAISNNKEVEVDLGGGKVYRGWFYNASHLLADSLGGRAFRNNVVTGTRMQNVGRNDRKGGMQYIEEKVRKHISDNPDVVVYYQATPVYLKEDNLVPVMVQVKALSSDGIIDETVVTYNEIKNFSINYKTGEFSKVE